MDEDPKMRGWPIGKMKQSGTLRYFSGAAPSGKLGGNPVVKGPVHGV